MKTEKNLLTVKPVKKYAEPKYPTKTAARQYPELLRRLPSRWEKNAKVVAAAGLLGAIALTSCGLIEPSKTEPDAVNNPGMESSENFLNVAPVFFHGEGSGAMGCLMIVPPVFLSEQEAIAIIKGETESAGLNFTAGPPDYVATNNIPKEISQYSWENPKYVLGGGTVGLDLYDDKKGVAVTFISMNQAEVIYPDMHMSVVGYNPRELAELTAEDFARQKGGIAVGVFYDPGRGWEDEAHKKVLEEYENSDKDWETKRAQYESDTKALIEEDLRNQVRDFIEWLQAQGIM